jgi:hypothetical protein
VDAEEIYVAPIEINASGVKVSAATHPAGPFCNNELAGADEAVFHHIPSDALTPEEDLASSPNGWTAVQGTLVFEQDEPPLLCDSNDQEVCIVLSMPFLEDQELLVGASPEPKSEPRRRVEIAGPTWVALVIGGEVVDLAHVIPPEGVVP